MSIFPVRGLAAEGILRDPEPYSLDLNAWSDGANVRMHTNYAERAPVWRTVYGPLPITTPAFCVGVNTEVGGNWVLFTSLGNRIWKYTGGVATELSPPTAYGWSSFINSMPYTACQLGDVIYLNRDVEQPFFYPPTSYTNCVLTTTAANTAQTLPFTNTKGVGVGQVATGTGIPANTIVLSFIENTSVTLSGSIANGAVASGTQVTFTTPANTFAPLPGWQPTWSCNALRTYNNVLVAMNVTKGATNYPNMVKTSDLALYAQAPGSWNQNDLSTLATENPLEHLTTPLVDGCTLRNGFVLYSRNEIWLMQATTTSGVYTYNRLFGEGGMISPNCCVEVDGVHYVFGPNDIYQHDGVNKTSLVDGRDRNAVFRYLIQGQISNCFVTYLPMLDSIVFAYPSADPKAAYQNPNFCNVGLVYDRNTNTCSFIDLPDVSAITQVFNIAGGATYATTTDTYASTTATYGSYDWDVTGSMVATSSQGTGVMPNRTTQSRLLLYDFADKGSQTGLPALLETNPPAYLQRTGIDLDQIGANITTYKLVRRIFPLVQTFNGAKVQVQVGSQLVSHGPISWLPPVNFDPTKQYKVDVKKGGRFLAVKIIMPTTDDFQVTGFDVDLIPNGRR